MRNDWGPMVLGLFAGIALTVLAIVLMYGTPTAALHPVEAYCRGHVDGVSYTRNQTEGRYTPPEILDQAEQTCVETILDGGRPPGGRGPLLPG